MSLSDFITDEIEVILQGWEDFANTLEPAASMMDGSELRDHASLMLLEIAADLRTPQTEYQQVQKSRGLRPRTKRGDTAAETHADARLASGYTIAQLVSEYRALRSNVLRLWINSSPTDHECDLNELIRFNEAIDQALAESVARYDKHASHQADTERARLNALLEAAPVGITMNDIDGKLILANAENRHIWGNHPVSKNVADFSQWKGWWADGSEQHGTALQPHDWPVARALAGEERPHAIVEIEPFGLPGTRRTIMLQAGQIRNSDGAMIGAVVAQIDISAWREVEAKLRESEEKFRTITNAMPQMVWSTLPDGFHDYYNQQWYDYTGVPAGSTDGEGWNGMFHPDEQQIAWERWRHSLATGETYEIQYRLRHRSGEYRWVLGRALPVRDDAGKIIRWMGTCTDIHDQKLAEAELRESSSRKDEFLAMLAHELRNPLAPISAAAQILKMTGANEKVVKQASDVIGRQVKHMTTLVDDLLDVSRVTRGLAALEKLNVDMKSVISAAIEQAGPLVEERQHQLHLHLQSAHAYVKGDKTRLTQVITNLLNNAAKYTPNGGEIELRLAVQKDRVEVSVTDNGCGISPSLLPHIFDLFTQANRTPDRSQGGLGLGLALVKSIANLHGGRVAARSEGMEKGSTFTLMLPLVSPQQRADVNDGALKHHQASMQGAGPVSLMIVDDNVDAAESLGALLRANGHNVTVHERGRSALAEALNNPRQVYVLDIGLPDMDGYELARQIRASTNSSDAILIALTGYGQSHDRILSKAAGFDHHFVKPIDSFQLLNILAQAETQVGLPTQSGPDR